MPGSYPYPTRSEVRPAILDGCSSATFVSAPLGRCGPKSMMSNDVNFPDSPALNPDTTQHTRHTHAHRLPNPVRALQPSAARPGPASRNPPRFALFPVASRAFHLTGATESPTPGRRSLSEPSSRSSLTESDAKRGRGIEPKISPPWSVSSVLRGASPFCWLAAVAAVAVTVDQVRQTAGQY